MESRLGEWVEVNKIWAFKTAPPTTGGLYVAITQCLHAVHIAASTHDHVCILVFCLRISMYIYVYRRPVEHTGCARRGLYHEPDEVLPLESRGFDLVVHIDLMQSQCMPQCTHRCVYIYVATHTEELRKSLADKKANPKATPKPCGVQVRVMCAFVACIIHIAIFVHCYVHMPHRIGSTVIIGHSSSSDTEKDSDRDRFPNFVQQGRYPCMHVLLVCAHAVVVRPVQCMPTYVFVCVNVELYVFITGSQC